MGLLYQYCCHNNSPNAYLRLTPSNLTLLSTVHMFLLLKFLLLFSGVCFMGYCLAFIILYSSFVCYVMLLKICMSLGDCFCGKQLINGIIIIAITTIFQCLVFSHFLLCVDSLKLISIINLYLLTSVGHLGVEGT